MNYIDKTICTVFKRLYDCSGLKGKFIAQKIGVDENTVSAWKKGKNAPKTENIIALAELFGVKPYVFYQGILPGGGRIPEDICEAISQLEDFGALRDWLENFGPIEDEINELPPKEAR